MTNGNAVRTGVDDYIFDVMRIVDVVILIVSAYAAHYFRFGDLGLNSLHYYGVILTSILYLFSSHTVKLYNLRNFNSKITQVGLISTVLVITFFAYILLLYITKSGEEVARLWMMYWWLMTYGGVVFAHIIFIRWFRARRAEGKFVRNIVLYGDAERAKMLIEQFKDRSDAKLLAVVIEGAKSKKTFSGVKVLTGKDSLKKFCFENRVDDVILTMDVHTSKPTEEILEKLSVLPCNICYCLPSAFFGKFMPSMPLTTAPVVTVFHRPLAGRKVWLKRMEDIVLGSLILVGISPFLILIALALLISGEPKVIFKQARGGFNGNTFTMYKFRSMKEHKETDVIQQAQKGDMRITKLGAFLRKTSLDELPQILNVVKGDMSLVGPRPHAVSHDDHYGNLISSYAARNKMKPGITGWAQVNGWRGETETLDKMEGRVRYDIHYIENWSLWLDIKILFLTAAVFLPSTQKNVY